MCGITASWARNDRAAATLVANGRKMLDSIAHRGPDGTGLMYFRPGTGAAPQVFDALGAGEVPRDASIMLGHMRLAILDPTDCGLQPMASEDGTIWLTFNGEVYNYVELREDLKKLGYRFKTGTDTEVMIYAYDAWGVDFLDRLSGMFAFVLYDARRGTLLLARDQLGIKPLYYFQSADTLVAASEIKAILASGVYQKDVDWRGAYHYFSFLYVPNPLTMFKGIRQVQPGQYVEVDLATGASRVERYWHVRERPDIAALGQADLEDAIRTQLTQALGRQMRSDVPIGSFLSGGVDSTIVTGLMTEHSDKVKTYTVTFPEKEYAYFNESEVARAVSDHLGTEHIELPIRLSQTNLILELLDHFDQPFGNPTYYLMYLISREARKHITVALNGAGGDELYAGYPRYKAARLATHAHRLPGFVLDLISSGVQRVPDRFSSPHLRRIKGFMKGLDSDFVNQYLKWTYFLSDDEKGDLLHFPNGRVAESKTLLRDLYSRSEITDPANRLLELDVSSFLVDNVLEYTDKMSMAVALEVRVPVLDHEFVELSLNVPYHYKLRGNKTKYLLRRVFDKYFPEEARKAPKRGFVVPLAQWMRSTFDSYFDDGVEFPFEGFDPAGVGQSWKTGLLRKDVIDQYRAQHKSGAQDRSYELFGIMLFDIWLNRYFG